MIPVKSAAAVDSRNLIGDANDHSISKDTFSRVRRLAEILVNTVKSMFPTTM